MVKILLKYINRMDSADLKLRPLETLSPVCSLKALNDELLFAAEGPLLSLYNYTSGEKVFSRQVFPRNKIHGIQILGKTVAVWGGQTFSVFTIEEFKTLSCELPLFGVGDWITYILLTLENELHVLSAHNLVHTVRIVDTKLQLLKSRNCGWKSILYSGALHCNSDTGEITVLAGTVMNGIILWDLESCEMKHNLTQHEGSIFNITASEDGKYLASCSDDRSIKVWNMSTGALLANGWGHGSRIWGLSIYNTFASGFQIFSASEDCTARVWTYSIGHEELTQERIVHGHTGRHVWSVDVYGPSLLGFTGGADGKILVTDLGQKQRKGYLNKKWELATISEQTAIKFEKGELVKEYVDFGTGLLAVTTLGNVLVLENYTKWQFLFQDTRFNRFCIVRAFESLPFVILGNKHGNIYFLKFDLGGKQLCKLQFDVSDSLSRLANILVCETNNRSELSIFFESSNPRDPIIYHRINSQSLEAEEIRHLIKPDEKIILNTLAFDEERNMFFFGCRFATLLVYQLSVSDEPYATYTKIIKGDTMSSIHVIPNTKNCTLYLTNKDSNYYIVEFDDLMKPTFLQSSKIQRGFLEGMVKGQNNDVLLYGFKSDCFFLWNETGQYEVMREICGGPHRRWSFRTWKENGFLKYRFIYTRASEIQLVQSGASVGVETLARGLHGREVRDIAIVDSLNQDEKIVITGAEDTTLKIATLDKNGTLNLDWTYREHVAGMQSVHAVNSKYVISTSAREELFVWKLSVCDSKKCMSLYAKLPAASANPDLRIMNFDTVEVFNNGILVGFVLVSVYSDSSIKLFYFDIQNKSFTLLINDRYQKCCIFHSKILIIEGSVYILIGSTNGHITLYDVTETVCTYFTVKQKTFDLISIQNVVASKLKNLVINQQLHQSSIKALALLPQSNSQVVLVTGGDDNSLIVSELLKIDSVTLSVKAIEEAAASSTITTISAVDSNHILVGAVDQIVKLWNVVDSTGKLILQLEDERYTTIADTGCSEIAHFSNGDKLLVLGGAGVSVWRL